MIGDRLRLTQAWERLRALRGEGEVRATRWAQLRAAIAAAQAKRTSRAARLPQPTYPAELPVAARRAEIQRLIADHQVTIVCGETGSGKTTQIPKFCLELGRGIDGLIGHTQPRRIAARTVAARIAQELHTPLGALVGYKVRFQDKLGAQALVKVMTDGILLAETQSDPLLSSYDTLIIDEAHERSLNIDFLLGYLHRLLPKRPDLKVVITSATIDAERFSRHFDHAPVIEVSGRLFPVEVRYRPPDKDDDEEADAVTLTDAILAAIDEAHRLGPGHALVFLPGEREIRETAEALRKHHPPGTEVLPLYARLSAAAQERVFAPTQARRIVLATNVAETSLTVPGVRYVIDPGLARVNRYNYRRKVEQLLTEKIPQAAANQRAGRCGRVMSGVCFRLYDEADFLSRPAFGDPELLRSSLAAVILRMKALDLGRVEEFPFLDPPQPRMIADGYQLLSELGAVDEARTITPLGRELARLPIDPRIARMVLEARNRDCLKEILIIAAALSILDPRDRPLERAQAADDRHSAFRDEQSDFAGLLKLWNFYQERIRHLGSHRKLSHELRECFLSPARMREWREVHTQLHALVAESGMRVNEVDASYEAVHRSLLAGLLGNIGNKNEQGDYEGTRGLRFVLHPSSAVRKKAPRWVMAAELVETSRLYARHAARIEPDWVEQAAAHLIKRSWFEPRWDKEGARVVAWEQVSLHGLIIVPRRVVHYGTIEPARAREMFIRAGLVEGGYVSAAPFQRHNARLRREIEELEHKSRRRDLLVNEDSMVEFFDARIPPGICNGTGFEAWRKQAERAEPRLLFMARENLMRHTGAGITAALFPPEIEVEGVRLGLRYRFDPGHPLDGVTVTVPLHLLNRVSPHHFDRLVPGLLRDKVNALLRALPKTLRRACVPMPETVTACLQALDRTSPDVPLGEALGSALRMLRAIEVAAATWDALDIPEHLRMRYRVVDDRGSEIAAGRDLQALRRAHGGQAQARFAPAAPQQPEPIRAWGDLELPESILFERGGQMLRGYPALSDQGDHVQLVLLESADKAYATTRAGLCRLVRLTLREQVRALERAVTPGRTLALTYATFGTTAQLTEDLMRASIERAVWADPAPVRNRVEFDARIEQVKARLQVVGREYLQMAERILTEAAGLTRELSGSRTRAFKHAVQDMSRQLDALVFPGFIAAVPYARLCEYPRYLKAMRRRIEKLPANAERDLQHTQVLSHWWQQYLQRVARDRQAGLADVELDAFRWMLEEQRVSLFAQELRTPYPVSYKRLERAWSALG